MIIYNKQQGFLLDDCTEMLVGRREGRFQFAQIKVFHMHRACLQGCLSLPVPNDLLKFSAFAAATEAHSRHV